MRVTVGISFFNNEKTLADAIRSVFAQTFQDWELILIDDGSTDGSLAIAKSVDDPRVRVFSDGENRGAPYRLNQITELAQGEYIARMDGDDIMHPDRLAAQVEYLDSNPNVDIVSNGIYIIDGRNDLIGIRCLEELDANPATVLKRGVLVQGTAMGRTEWWRRFPYDTSCIRAEENDLWCRSCAATTFDKITLPLYFCREQSKPSMAYLRDYLRSAKSLRGIYRKYGPSMVGRRRTIGLIAQTYVKGEIYRAATYLGLQNRLISRRNRDITSDEKAQAEEALRRAMQTHVPGLLDAAAERQPGRLRLCRIVTTPLTFTALLRSQMKTISDNDIDCTLVSSPGEGLEEMSRELSLRCHAVEMSRDINLLQDIKSLLRLYRFFRSERFDIVHSSTAKAGLLAAVASWLARVPIRIHTFTGQRWVELQGVRRWIVRLCDRIIAVLSTHCYADSHSQRGFLISEGLIEPIKISVLASGSISGVDLNRFDPDVWTASTALETRRALGIEDDAIVVLFVGRVNRDKGITELTSAFRDMETDGKVELLLVGPFEPEYDPLPKPVLDELTNSPYVTIVGQTQEPERYMGASDILCLPSYREGFGSVVIEAAAMGVPAVATSIVGLTDAVEDGVTGLLAKPKDVESLCKALVTMISGSQLRNRMGKAARDRARRLFDAAVVNQAVADEYLRLHARLTSRKPWLARDMERQAE